MQDKIFIHGLTAKCRIGIFDWEKKIQQKIVIDLEFPVDARRAARHDRIRDTVDYQSIASHAVAFAAKDRFALIETLAEKLAASILAQFPVRQLTLRISKPGAIRSAQNVGVQIRRKQK